MAAAGTAEEDTHMEELVDHGLGMEEETDHGLLRKESYQSDCLLAPDTDFMTDDRSSAASGLDVVDRLTYLEQRMQMQEDEIQLLKMALADVLKRLNISEEHQAASAGRRTTGAKTRPVSLALPSKPSMMTSSTASLRKSCTAPSSATSRNYSPTPLKSGVKSTSASVKDSPCKITRSRPTSAASTWTRRVTHCKVTMQIYLSPLTRKTGSSEAAKSGSTVPANDSRPSTDTPPGNPQVKGSSSSSSKAERKKTTPSFTLNLQKTTTSQMAAQDTPSYKSPTKSPSQYFQICY
uniref:Echinoderm microtubule-associated protein-like 4 n=1 Tax=Gouania willdenowi TaxID=441366 RepID=A0A8C5GJM1_GOUWI